MRACLSVCVCVRRQVCAGHPPPWGRASKLKARPATLSALLANAHLSPRSKGRVTLTPTLTLILARAQGTPLEACRLTVDAAFVRRCWVGCDVALGLIPPDGLLGVEEEEEEEEGAW